MSDLIVATRRHALKQRREIAYVPEGQTVEELVCEFAELPSASPFWVEARIGGVVVPKELWTQVRPKPGETLAIDVEPTGGEDGAKVAGVLSVIIGIIGIAFGGYALIYGGVSLLSAKGISAIALVASGALMVASGVQSLLTPPPQLRFDGEIPTSNQPGYLVGTRNRIRYNGPIRRVFGRHRLFPDFGGKPYTEYVGSDQFLRLLYHVGYGPLNISSLRIGETPVENLGLTWAESDAATFETDIIVHNGFDDDGDLMLFTQEVDEDRDLALPMFPVATEHIVVTELDTQEASFDFQFPSGLIGFEDDGTPVWESADYTLEYREAGTADAWADAVLRTPLNPGVIDTLNGSIKIRGTVRGTVTYGVAIVFPSRKQWEVRFTVDALSSNGNGADYIFNEASLIVVRSMRPFEEATFTNLCRIEMRIKATDFLNGLLDSFNVQADALYPDEDGAGGYYEQRRRVDRTNNFLVANRSFDLAFVEILKGPGARRRLQDADIDQPSLQAWATLMTSLGRTLDGLLEAYTTVADLLNDVCGAGRAALSIIDGKYGVILNDEKTVLVDHLSHRNSHSFTSFREFREPVHAIKVSFVDDAAAYQPNEITVYNDGYDETNAEKFDQMRLWGITDADQAYREGRFQLADWQLRPRLLSCKVGLRSLRLQRGDLVRASFTTIGKGLASGRLNNVTINAGNLVSATTDEALIFGSGSYAVRVQTSDGNTIVGDIIPAAAGQQIFGFTFVTPQAIPGVNPANGDLFMFGERGEESGEFVVYQIRHEAGLTATVELVDHSPAIFTADEEPIPDYDPGVTRPHPLVLATPNAPSFQSIVADESALTVRLDGAIQVNIDVEWILVDNPEVKANQFQIQMRQYIGPSAWQDVVTLDASQTRYRILDVEENTSVEIRIRSISVDGRFSTWTKSAGIFISGTLNPPPPIQNLRREGLALIRWDYPNPPKDLKGFRVRRNPNVTNPTWETSNDVQDGFTTETYLNPLDFTPPGSPEFALVIVAEDRRGNVSTEEYIILNLGLREPANTVTSWDERIGAPIGQTPGTAWNGTKSNMTVDGGTGDLEADSDPSDLFWLTGNFWTASTDDFWKGGFLAFSYTTPWLDVTAPGVAGTLFLREEIESAGYLIEVESRTVGGGGETGWMTWTGELFLETRLEYRWKLSGPASNTQTKVIEFIEIVGKEDEVTYVNDWYCDTITAAGPQRVPLALIPIPYVKVRTVLVTIVGDPTANGPTSIVVYDKGIPNDGATALTGGPSIEVLKPGAAGGTAFSQANLDIEIRGYS